MSCDTYGTRWKTEDIVGVMVDMDLLEMKFFLNGTDLGSAFVNFASNGLYPALSLNVRQCLRVNYGQEKFMFPPTEVDGLPFRPVIEALKNKEDDVSQKQAPNISAVTPAKGPLSAPIADTRESPVGPSGTIVNAAPNVPMDSTGSTSATSTSVFVTDSPTVPAPTLGEGTSAASSNVTARRSPRAAGGAALDRVITVDEEDEGEGSRSSRRGADADQGGEGAWRVGSRNRQRRGSRDVNGLPVSTADATEVSTSHLQNHDDFFSRQQVSTSSPELEARRQLLIENLIGMGFPVDWALRAAEHCDASVSESNAIAWIIER